jgi:antirestriction protein ArdC
MASDKAPYHEEFAAKVIEDLKNGTAPWLRPWEPGELHAPVNPVSGTVYKGINRIMLSRHGYDDPRWMTMKQANTLGCHVRKGEKSQRIVFWQFKKQKEEMDALDDNVRPKVGADGKPVVEEVELSRPIIRFSSVFHASQIEGPLPPFDPDAVKHEWDPHKKCEEIIAASGAQILHNQRDRAFYSPAKDRIELPPKDHFPSADRYYATALHEVGHWTGHESRLGRETGIFGTPEYAREELRAEIASWMMGQDLGIGHDPGQHAAYIESWIKLLEEDSFEIVRACRDAEKIKNYILEPEKQKERAPEVVIEDRGQATPVASEASPEASGETAGRVYLDVPYREKNRAKALGAKWDRDAKSWYAPEGVELGPLSPWLTKEIAPEKTPDPTPEPAPSRHEEFLSAIAGQLQGGTPSPDPQIPGHVGRNAQGDNICAVNDEHGQIRAWGVYSDDGRALMSQGDPGWKEALDNLAGEALMSRDVARGAGSRDRDGDEPSQEKAMDDRDE